MTIGRTNIVKLDRFGREVLTVFLESKWVVYSWWLCSGTIAGALGAITFNQKLNARWWIFPVYVALVLGIRWGLMQVARRVFPGDSWWVATNVFLPTLILAGVGPAISLKISWPILAIPIVIGVGFYVGLVHSGLRVVFVRAQFAWIWSGAAIGAITAFAGWLAPLVFGPVRLVAAGVIGAAVGLLYILLTTVLLEYMWDAASALAQRGMLAVDKQAEFTEGLSYIDLALSIEPNNARLYAARAEVYFKQGGSEEAHANVERALSLDSRSPEARVMRANLLAEAGDLDGAIAIYDEVIADTPKCYAAYLNSARAHARKGNFDRAWDDCGCAVRLADDGALTQITYGDINYRMGNYKAALKDCDRTLKIRTVTPVAWAMALVLRGKCQIINGDFELAAANFQTAMARSFDAATFKDAVDGLTELPSETEEDVAAEHEAI